MPDQVTMTGPDTAAHLEQMAALWEADLVSREAWMKSEAEMLARAERAEAALEQARALAEKWAAMKYNGDLTAAVYHGCAEELAALLSPAAPDGAA